MSYQLLVAFFSLQKNWTFHTFIQRILVIFILHCLLLFPSSAPILTSFPTSCLFKMSLIISLQVCRVILWGWGATYQQPYPQRRVTILFSVAISPQYLLWQVHLHWNFDYKSYLLWPKLRTAQVCSININI